MRDAWNDYVYLRDNPAGGTGIWYHAAAATPG
jgi:sarcosine oxidase delta subunit